MNAPFDRLHADLAGLADEVRVVDLRDRTLRTSRRLAVRRTLLGAAAVAAVVAIGAGTAFVVLPGRHAALPAGPGPSDQSTPTAAPTPEAPSVSASAATDAPSASGSSAPATTRCHTNELRVTMQNSPGGGAAGSVYTWLIFTNVSARTCTLYGFPGVSYVTGPDGQQVNDPATRNNAIPSRTTLDPGHAAYAQLQTGHPEAFPDTCKPVTVAGYRVYPPDETAAVFVPAPTQQCSTNGVNATFVSPVVPLPGQ